MPTRIKQYQDVCLYGITGAILNGDFVQDGSGEDTIPNMYIRQSIALTNMMITGGYAVHFDYDTGMPSEVDQNFMGAYWTCSYKLPVSAEGEEVVVKFHTPEYIIGQHASYIYLDGANYTSVEQSPVSGATAAYLDKECTQLLEWSEDPSGNTYFICPEDLYFKLVAGGGGSYPHSEGETVYDYSLLQFRIQYAAKDLNDIYQ